MTNRYLPSKLELEAKKILGDLRAAETSGAYEAMIANALEALWWASLPVDRIIRIGTALSNLDERAEERRPVFQKALTRLVRAKILRSRRDRGVTLYEINFTA